MDKILAIARAEYVQAVRSKAFLVGLFLMPVLMGGSILAQLFLKDQVDLEERVCAVVDETGELYPVLEEMVSARNELGIWKRDEETGELVLDEAGEKIQRRPIFRLERTEPAETRPETELMLSDRVRDGELIGFAVIDSEALGQEAEDASKLITYHTDEPTFTELKGWLESTLNEEILRRRFAETNLDQAEVATLVQRVPVKTWGLVSMGEDGEIGEAEEEDELRTFLVPFGGLMLMFLLVMTSAPQLMNQVLEEKMQRISEVLVSAVSPFQLMMGKLFGSVGVCLTLAIVYLSGVAWALNYNGIAHYVPTSAYVWFLVMMVFGLLMYGSLFSALGSACSELRDAQTMMMPALLLIMIPMFAWNAVIEAPNGSVATFLTYVPTATPSILILRLLVSPGPPAWEIPIAFGVCVLTTMALVWASGKIFRIGVLSQGQPPTFRGLIGWVLSK